MKQLICATPVSHLKYSIFPCWRMCLARSRGYGGPRDPPNTCVSMGELNILDEKIGHTLRFPWFSLDFWLFHFLGRSEVVWWADSDSLTCFAAWGWSQIAVGWNYEGFMAGTGWWYETWLPKLIFQIKELRRYCELEPRTWTKLQLLYSSFDVWSRFAIWFVSGGAQSERLPKTWNFGP